MKKIFLLSVVTNVVVLSILFFGKQISDPDYAELYQLMLLASGISAFAVSILRHKGTPRLVIATFLMGLLPCLLAWQTAAIYIVGTVVLSMINRGETWRQLEDAFCQE